jgi:hypothetical protein
MITRLISGGQTGVDRAALDVALALCIPCGGKCPRGRRAEDGPLDPRYLLEETASEEYPVRTEANVRESDGTLVLLSGQPDRGTALTIELAAKYQRPCLCVDLGIGTPAAVRFWIELSGIEVLNVAGPRESAAPGIYTRAQAFMREVFADWLTY